MKLGDSKKTNSILNRIEKDIRLNKNTKKNLEKLESLLSSQPYFKFRIENDIAEIYVTKGNYPKALELSKELFELDGGYESARKYFEILIKLGDFKEAKNCVDSLEESPEKEYLLGMFYRKIGNVSSALKHYSNLRYTVMEDNGNLEYAYLYRSLKDYAKAKEHLNKLLNTEHRDTALRELIHIELETGNNDILSLIKKLDIERCERVKQLQKVKRIIVYYKYLKGNIDFSDFDSKEYYEKQLINYSYERAIEHVRKGHTGHRNAFKIVGNLDDVFNYCKSHLNNLINSDVSDTYLVKFPYDIGKTYNFKTNLMNVVTIPHTDKILTFYPISNPVNYMMQIKESKTK